MPKVDLSLVPVHTGSDVPVADAARMAGRSQQAVAAYAGLTQFGANLVRLAPGAMSALRHWHEQQDEFLMVTQGELTLIEDGGKTVLTAGDCAAFKAGVANGHHVVNLSDEIGTFLVIGTHTPEETGHYPDHDMVVQVDASGYHFRKTNGAPMDGPSTIIPPQTGDEK